MSKQEHGAPDGDQEVSNKILTVPNVISFIRLCFIPVFLALLFNGYDVAATLVYAIAAGTDWIDGQIARRTNAVSKLGQVLDPTVDRLLMISGVVGLCIVGRLPVWIVVVVVVRDLFLLGGGAILLFRFHTRVAVVYPGKVATTCLFVGFVGLLLNWPLIPGLGLTEAAWLPGFNAASCSWGIWFVYIGLALAIATTVYYIYAGIKALKKALKEEREQEQEQNA